MSTKSSDTQCQIRITETLPAAVFSKKDLAENHLTMHQVMKYGYGKVINEEVGTILLVLISEITICIKIIVQ